MELKDYVAAQKDFRDVFVLDVHGHIGTECTCQLGAYDADSIAHTVTRLGVNAICVSAITSLRSDFKLGNDHVAEACAAHPGVILGYASPTPFYDYDLSKYFEADRGFRGIKIHGNMQGETPENDPRYDKAYELANRLHLPVLFHAWMPYEVEHALDVARRYPDLTVILGHSGLTMLASKENAIAGCKKYDNVMVDTAISGTYDGAIEWIVDKVGEDRVCYGSDMAFFECDHTLGKVAMTKLSDTAKEKILGLNVKSLFGF